MAGEKGWNLVLTGGAGYVGSALVPELLAAGHRVTVFDLYMYGDDVLSACRANPDFQEVKGDLRDRKLVEKTLRDKNAVIHLACVSNDPSFELDPELGRKINYDAFKDLVDISIDSGVERFVYASSSSVYGVKDDPNVTEDLPLEPLTDYSKYKALCEEVLDKKRCPGFNDLTVRPATVCGYAPRLRLDLAVNILTNHAVNNRLIKVFGGEQMRPNIHISDMVRFYLKSLEWPAEKIRGGIYNAGYQNLRVREIAELVQAVVGDDVKIESTPTDDNRSYHISSDKIRRELGFEAEYTVEDAVRDLVSAFGDGLIPNPMDDDRYYNIRTMKRVKLQ